MSTLREQIIKAQRQAEFATVGTLEDVFASAADIILALPEILAALERQGERHDNGYDPSCPTCASHTTPVPCGAHDPRVTFTPELNTLLFTQQEQTTMQTMDWLFGRVRELEEDNRRAVRRLNEAEQLLVDADSHLSWMLHRRPELWDRNKIGQTVGCIRRFYEAAAHTSPQGEL